MVPASIRYNNPGAMWGGNAISKRWGEQGNVKLNDGLAGQNNHIAVFPDMVHGAAAQFDLWRSRYANMTLAAAVRKWSGGNSSSSYMGHLTHATGLSEGDMVTPAVLSSDQGLALMKAQAGWEAGQTYPMSDIDWAQAQHMVFNRVTNERVKKGAVVVTTTGGLAEALSTLQHQLLPYAFDALIAVSAVVVLVWLYRSLKNV